MYGKQFVGGIRDSSIARLIAPDLIVSKQYSERSRYLKRLRNADICIGTTGLHDSIGWKTAESCIDAVQRLLSNSDLVYQIKLNNLLYYYQYLKPDIMIKRTLDIVDANQ